MAEWLQENWLLAVVALVAALLLAWWLFVASRRTRVEISRADENTPAKRNQALIDAAPPADLPPPAPMGLAGVAEIVQAAAEPVPAAAPSTAPGDDLTRIKGLGPKIADQLAALGVTTFAQIAAWDEAEIDRVDAELGRFQGRIRRDDWPGQAKLLAAGDTQAYEKAFGKL
jgi:predicted flap endonuclease-1-like 5' DNA nuclease